jgi:triosephosphate isomerase
MILDAGAAWVLTGHSERRHILHENNTFVGQKTSFALACGLNVIACVGETLEEREAGKLYDVLTAQLNQTLAKLPTPLSPERLVIAYEPVWAIGTGKTANNEDIIEAHAIIRELLKDIIGTSVSQTRILYGGSVKAENASEIIKLENVDGLLVGGASLKAESFAKIICA